MIDFMYRRAFSTVVLAVAGAAGCGAAPGSPQADDLASSSAQLQCAAFDQYRAVIAHSTIACTGTIGPQSFRVDAAGYLERAFDACTAADAPPMALRDIDDFLSLQRKQDLPGARSCFADQWSEWQVSFVAHGNNMCPVWTQVGAEGSPTYAAVAALARNLPQPAFDLRSAPGQALDRVSQARLSGSPTAETVAQVEENFLYRVSFGAERPNQPCGTAESCAAQCAAGLPGFYLGERDGLVVGDPVWSSDTTLYAKDANPYLGYDFYHPMSFYRALPGARYAHKHRAGEKCSYYVFESGFHMIGQLVGDCVDPTDMATCTISHCDPLPGPTPGPESGAGSGSGSP